MGYLWCSGLVVILLFPFTISVSSELLNRTHPQLTKLKAMYMLRVRNPLFLQEQLWQPPPDACMHKLHVHVY